MDAIRDFEDMLAQLERHKRTRPTPWVSDGGFGWAQ